MISFQDFVEQARHLIEEGYVNDLSETALAEKLEEKAKQREKALEDGTPKGDEKVEKTC